MPQSRVETDLQRRQFVDAIDNRNVFSDYLDRSGIADRASNPQHYSAIAEGVFSAQARNVTADTRLRIDQSLSGLQGLGSGLQEKSRAALAATQVGKVSGIRSATSNAAAAEQTRAEQNYLGMLQRLSEIDSSILDLSREFAVRSFDAGNDPDILGGLEGNDLQTALAYYDEIRFGADPYGDAYVNDAPWARKKDGEVGPPDRF
jgi:hypothetical protein